ncbi:flagellar assembly protein FliX, partial [Bradyrhizobium sp.]|uniref:flagellar assembly protein FliX n=1 Tax=Bradyrhizobium sp. TaxID=376 RepID=UPI002725AE44
MRIYGPTGTTLGSSAGNAKRSSSTGFSLPEAATAAETRSAAPPKAAGNIDALLALQGVEDPTERRKRSVQ